IGITAIRAGTVGLYPTNPAAEVLHVLRDSGSCVLIAEDQEQVDKYLEIADELPDLRTVVYIDPRGIRGHYDDPRLMAWEDFVALGEQHRADHPDAVTERLESAQPDDLATLVYTSGTTGPPKGAMLSIANIEFVIETLQSGGAFVDPPASD